MHHLLSEIDEGTFLHYPPIPGQYIVQEGGYHPVLDAPPLSLSGPLDIQSNLATVTDPVAPTTVLMSPVVPSTMPPATTLVMNQSTFSSTTMGHGRSPKVARIGTTAFGPFIAPSSAVTRPAQRRSPVGKSGTGTIALFRRNESAAASGDGNPIGLLNSAVQSARGSKMNITWTYLLDAKRSLHGCLIRSTLSRAVDEIGREVGSGLAISQNVGGWIAGISETIENLLPQDVKQKTYSLVSILTHECKRAGLDQRPVYSFDHEEGAIGCTLRVAFDPSSWREYMVPVQYRTRLGARLVAVL
ncbi:hypothetical protein CPB86DRAFT_820512 [Serendipita vermifera]|nr:hypothetical protein CPB86DRAFT_820512 [Serendipita vermifera]